MEFLISPNMGRVIIDAITSPFYLLVYFLLVLIITWQYKRLESISEKLVNSSSHRYLQSALISSAIGLLGGMAGSILLIAAGIDLNHIGFTWIWITALLLMLINPRFLCFAYAAGILSITNLLFSFPSISIPGLLGLVAILHMVESLLILTTGHLYPIPVYVKKNQLIRGGFNLQKFWPLPMIALVGTGVAFPPGMEMPGWWPLLGQFPGGLDGQAFILLPVVAVLGYGEITTTETPVQRVKSVSANLFTYSLMLLILSWLSCRHELFTIIAALFAPLGHELVIWKGLREENNQPPLYVKPRQGLKVLDIQAGSPAKSAGIRSGDIILAVNGRDIYHADEFNDMVKHERVLKLQIQRKNQVIQRSVQGEPVRQFGLIPVPDDPVVRYMQISEDSLFQLARRIWKKTKAGVDSFRG